MVGNRSINIDVEQIQDDVVYYFQMLGKETKKEEKIQIRNRF